MLINNYGIKKKKSFGWVSFWSLSPPEYGNIYPSLAEKGGRNGVNKIFVEIRGRKGLLHRETE